MSKESDLLTVLQALGKPENLEGMRHFGMAGETRLGIPIPELRRLAKEHGKDHLMAVSLWHSGIPEACILASMIENPEEVSIDQLEEWVADFNAWDVCDQVCMNLFEKVPSAVGRIPAWGRARRGICATGPLSAYWPVWHGMTKKLPMRVSLLISRSSNKLLPMSVILSKKLSTGLCATSGNVTRLSTKQS